MHITVTVHTSAYKFLWLKHVRAFNEHVHCAHSLIGDYSDMFPYKHRYASVNTGVYEKEIEATTPFHYLCGVTNKYADNLHIAFKEAPGEVIEYSDKDCTVRITDAVQLPIKTIIVHPFAKEFLTCRNWQFGWQYLREHVEA